MNELCNLPKDLGMLDIFPSVGDQRVKRSGSDTQGRGINSGTKRFFG